jgi:hypothetical protein
MLFDEAGPDGRERDRLVRSPVTAAMLRPLGAQAMWVTLHGPLAAEEYEQLADLMRPRPDVGLSIDQTYWEGIEDLDFLRHVPWLKRLYVHAMSVRDLAGLAHLTGIRDLIISQGQRSRSLLPLAALAPTLRCLQLEGPFSGIQALSELTGLRTLTLRSVSMPDLSALTPMTELAGLDLKLGNTRDLSLLPRFTKLQYFEAWLIRGLTDLSTLGEVTSLEELFLESLKHVTSLPSLHKLTRLRAVTLQNMNGIRDVSFLMTAPALEELSLHADNLDIASVNQLAAHPTLRKGDIGMRTLALQSAVTVRLSPQDSPSLYLALRETARESD